MNRFLFLSTVLALTSAGLRAQGPALVSPEIAADRQVVFRLQAPAAHEVTVSGQWAPGVRTPLSKDELGLWSAKVGPVEPGIYEYSFTVDSLAMVDPANPAVKPQRRLTSSILHVPGEPPLVWDWQKVPHGTLHLHSYFAGALGRTRDLVVYTPPGYEQSTSSYPLLVLLHGSGDNQAAWSQHGKAHWMMDNLLAEKKAQPMIVVMPDGHPVAAGMPGVARESLGASNSAAFERDLFEEILPLVMSAYRVRPDAADHAIAGLSMGAGQAFTCGLGHLDRFSWMGIFSGGVAPERAAELLPDPVKANAQMKLLWIAIGKGDRGHERVQQLADALEARGIRRTWILSEGDHSWPVWRGYFAEFVPLLFR